MSTSASSEELNASLICYTARPQGLASVLYYACEQDFQGSWELLIVDAFCEERKELVEEFCHAWNPCVKVTHVPPLKPKNRNYHSWDIPLYLNTAWSYARGRVLVHVEDYMCFKSDWLRTHVRFVEHHPNFVSIGDVLREPIFSEHDQYHHHRKPTHEMLKDWQGTTKIMERFYNPKDYGCVNAEHYGYWLTGNMGVSLDTLLRASHAFSGAPEIPTHYPESIVAPMLFMYGVSMWPLEGAPAWHVAHPKHQIAGKIMRVEGEFCMYDEVDQQDFLDIDPKAPVVKRDLIKQRKELGRWVPSNLCE